MEQTILMDKKCEVICLKKGREGRHQNIKKYGSQKNMIK